MLKFQQFMMMFTTNHGDLNGTDSHFGSLVNYYLIPPINVRLNYEFFVKEMVNN
jgi:hypothetical protein